MGGGTASVFTGLGFGQCPRDVHVNQPEGSIFANDLVPGSTRKIHRPAFLWATWGFLERRLFPSPPRKQEVARKESLYMVWCSVEYTRVHME